MQIENRNKKRLEKKTCIESQTARKRRKGESFKCRPGIYSRKIEMLTSITPEGHIMYRERDWHSFFGLVLDSVSPDKKNISEIEEMRTRLVSFFLRQPRNDMQFNLRVLKESPAAPLVIALIGKCKDPDKQLSRHKASLLFEDIIAIVEGFSVLKFRMVESSELKRILRPFRPVEIRGVSRESMLVDIDDESIMAVYPFGFNDESSLNFLLGLFVAHERPLMLDIGISPAGTETQKELRELARKVASARLAFEVSNPVGRAYIESYEHNIQIRRVIPIERPFREGNFERERALVLLENQISSLRRGFLFFSINIASTAAIPESIPETVVFDLFGQNARAKVSTLRGREMIKRWEEMECLNLQRRTCHGGIIETAVDLAQAKCAFQLPVPQEGRLCGIRVSKNGQRGSRLRFDGAAVHP